MARISILFLLSFLCMSSFSAVEKGPYLLFEGSNTKMTVMWQLDVTQNCTVKWGKTSSYELGSSSTSEYGSDHQHRYTITNLDPGTQYHYEVTGVGNGIFTTSPSDNANSVKLFAYGDTRTYPSDHNDVAREIVKQYTADPAKRTAVLFSGDYVSTGSNESDWTNQFFPRNQSSIVELHKNIPNIGTIGNHEGSSGSSILKKYYPFPHVDGHYWAFDYGPVRVFVVDQETKSFTTGSAQYNWLQNELASTTKEWKVVVFHAPGYSAGGGHSNDISVQNYLQPLFEQYEVDFVITGDNHYYSRAVVNGVTHITTGGGGAPLYNPNSSALHIVKTDKSNHFCELDFQGGVCTVTARRASGTVIETFDCIHETTVSIKSPSKDTTIETGSTLNVDAVVLGSGSISGSELLINNSVVDTDNSKPYSFNWTPSSAGIYELKVNATVGSKTVSSEILTVNVIDPVPEVAIVDPSKDTTVDINTAIDIKVFVDNVGLKVDSVVLFSNKQNIGKDISSPYSFSWSSSAEQNADIYASAFINGTEFKSENMMISVVDYSTKIFTDTFFVRNENDDAEEGIGIYNDTVFIDNPDLELVDDYDFMKDQQIVGIRFVDVDIPKDAFIVGSWIQFVTDESSDTITSINFRGHAVANSLPFAPVKGNISSREKTNAVVNWEPKPWLSAGDEGEDQKTPDLKKVVSEIIALDQWQSGNPITFIIDGSGRRVATSYNTGGASGASKLIISYKLKGSVDNVYVSEFKEMVTGLKVFNNNIVCQINNFGNYKLKVYSLDGKTIYSKYLNFTEGEHIVKWDNSEKSKGIYIVSLEGVNTKLINRILLK